MIYGKFDVWHKIIYIYMRGTVCLYIDMYNILCVWDKAMNLWHIIHRQALWLWDSETQSNWITRPGNLSCCRSSSAACTCIDRYTVAAAAQQSSSWVLFLGFVPGFCSWPVARRPLALSEQSGRVARNKSQLPLCCSPRYASIYSLIW